MAKQKIKLDPHNARLHDERNQRLIKKSLEDLGVGRSIVIDNEDFIVAGNGVFEQAKKLGIKTRIIESDGTDLVVIKRTDLSYDDPRRRGLAIADNATGETSNWDFDELQQNEVEEWGIEVPIIDTPTTKIDETHTMQLRFESAKYQEFKKMLADIKARTNLNNATDIIYGLVEAKYKSK